MENLLLRNLSRYVDFSQSEIDVLLSLVMRHSVPRKQVLLREGEKCMLESYIISGCARKYFIDKDGNEVNLQFATEDSWISDISFSIYETEPSHTFIETLEDCEMMSFTPQAKEKLFMDAPRFERAFRILMQRNVAATQQRLYHTIALTATERYLDFLKHYPTLPQRVAQHHIASYLGMSAEFLSKIRKRIAQAG